MTQTETLYSTMDELLSDQEFAGRPALDLIREIQDLYLEDTKPWVIGFSGGKDSSTVLSLIYVALLKLDKAQRHKHIYVVSSDTLVETPVVVDLVNTTIDQINQHAADNDLPISAHQVLPRMDRTFWVNLIGKGYPAPTQNFRWCTERMKIDPVSDFIKDKVERFGEVIVVLGARSQESASRAQVIAKHKIEGSSLSKHASLVGAYTYMPIEDWNFDEVWMYLLGAPCPWGGTHHELFDLYKDSNAGECPLVIDTKTPSCGNSRFGCWTCTVVTKDRAIEGLIESGETWMKRLKSLRNWLYRSTLPHNKGYYRNVKRRHGKVDFARNQALSDSYSEREHTYGPYQMKWRRHWLSWILRLQQELNQDKQRINLITEAELHNIREEWLTDPIEPDWDDTLPEIYQQVTGKAFEKRPSDSNFPRKESRRILESLEEDYDVPSELVMKLIDLQHSMDQTGNRRGYLDKIDRLLKQDWGTVEQIMAQRDATQLATELKQQLQQDNVEEQAYDAMQESQPMKKPRQLGSLYEAELSLMSQEYDALLKEERDFIKSLEGQN